MNPESTQPCADELLDTAEDLVCRPIDAQPAVAAAPVVVYLPGVHGDWTPMSAVRPHLGREVRLVELAYPRRADWSLDDYAAALAGTLDRLAIPSAHLLAESFGSLVGWAFTLAHPSRVHSLIVAGGFTRTPHPLQVGAARVGLRLAPRTLFEWGIDFYTGRIGHYAPKGVPGLDPHTPPFAAVRNPRGRRALLNRLRIIQGADFRGRLAQVCVPVAYLGGGRDLVVPCRIEVEICRAGLDKACRFRSLIIPGARHPILPDRPREATRFIVEWVQSLRGA